MPVIKSSIHPRRAGLLRPVNVGSFAGKQVTYLPSKVANDILTLIDQYDRISSNIEVQWRNTFLVESTAEFHGAMSNTRCDVYRQVILFLCTVPKIRDGKPHCPDECVQSRKERKKVTVRRPKPSSGRGASGSF